jgi:hypothetical protein
MIGEVLYSEPALNRDSETLTLELQHKSQVGEYGKASAKVGDYSLQYTCRAYQVLLP